MSIHQRMRDTKNMEEALSLSKEAVESLNDYVAKFDERMPNVVVEAVSAMAAVYGTEYVCVHSVPIEKVQQLIEMVHSLSESCYKAGVRDERMRQHD